MLVTQALLVFFGLLGTWVSIHQSQIARDSADQSRRAADLASDSFEINNGNFDRMMARTIDQTSAQIKAAEAAKTASDIARKELELTNRPWVKISHRIVKPLAFNIDRNKGPAAIMTIEDTVENVGPGVALNELSWEELFPLSLAEDGFALPDSQQPAYARQKQWCGANRRPQGEKVGNILFPHSAPYISYSIIGTTMKQIEAATIKSGALKGKAAFVIVGCVTYRSPIQPKGTLNHETQFAYNLGVSSGEGMWMIFIEPSGVASSLKIIEQPFEHSID